MCKLYEINIMSNKQIKKTTQKKNQSIYFIAIFAEAAKAHLLQKLSSSSAGFPMTCYLRFKNHFAKLLSAIYKPGSFQSLNLLETSSLLFS